MNRRKVLKFLAAGAAVCPTCLSAAQSFAETKGHGKPAAKGHGKGAPHWSYKGATDGMEQWGELSPGFRVCSLGLQQSPVDLRDSITAGLNPITLNYGDTATDEAVSAISGIGNIIGEMDEISATIASAVEEQGAATTEISGNAQQAATGTQEASNNVVQLTEVSRNTGEASGRVLEAADVLLKQASELDDQVEGFLKNIREA